MLIINVFNILMPIQTNKLCFLWFENDSLLNEFANTIRIIVQVTSAHMKSSLL
jgi:hypothetical protein